MGFQQALSGLNGASTALDAISNNIANAGTVGFKGSVTQFQDMFASSLGGAGNTKVGMGSAVASVTQQFTQGNMSTTNNPLDLAINGNGMFPMTKDQVSYSYTRNGQFQLDQSGNVVDSSGMKLCGYSAVNGNIVPSDPPVPLSVSSTMSFKETTTSDVKLNLSSIAAQPSAMTSGGAWPASTGLTIPTQPLALTIDNTNDVFTLSLDGQPSSGSYTISLTNKTYPNNYDLAAGVQTDINNALIQQGSTARVDVSYNSGGYLEMRSRGLGSMSQIASVGLPTGSTSTAIADLFGSGAAVAAAGTTGSDNFDPADPTTYTSTTSQTAYDNTGMARTVSVFFAKTAKPNVWQTYFTIDGQAATLNSNTTDTGWRPALLSYSSTGVFGSFTQPVSTDPTYETLPDDLQKITLSNGSATTAPTLSLTMSLKETSQTSLGFGVTSLTQDGYAAGTLAGIKVGADGMINATYTNGQADPAGQVALVSFRNPSALQAVGNNQWQETTAAGKQPTSTPGSDGLGSLQSGAVEQSNVDLTAELVAMITQQRAYQANAQAIKTQDQITQTIVNLR